MSTIGQAKSENTNISPYLIFYISGKKTNSCFSAFIKDWHFPLKKK